MFLQKFQAHASFMSVLQARVDWYIPASSMWGSIRAKQEIKLQAHDKDNMKVTWYAS